ncbi:MAG TPA: serine/threonine-protein kinase [Kofleriaceae bacterium]|nr:serine/threonine-protein kinase [Kofleriaceae bacterium]
MPTPGLPSVPPARYQLVAEIARGGMGRVVEANDITLGRVVAFKEALTTDSDTLRRFERETRITARLEHPSIVPVHDAGESSNGSPFYVMRKVSGRPLERLVAAAETLNERLALLPHIVNSAQAIAHAHERGIVHRDIKPSNILVGELGETVVIDWGLAKVIGEPDEQTTGKPLVDLSDSLKTRAGIVYGTPGFMAPEQLRGVPVTEGCDVYALGATLYHLLSRKPPHYAKTADEMMKAAVAAPPTPIHKLVDGVPPDLSTIVDKALAHDPKVRYQNARALAEDLQRFLTGQLVASHHYSPREKLVRFIKKNRGVSAAVAALILVGSFAVIRIIIERNRADRAAVEARDAERQTGLRADALQLSQARLFVDINPTVAVAMVKPLARKYWQDARAIGAAARAIGVAWGIPASKHTASLEMSHDGLRALSAGTDGMVRIHDLVKHTSRTVIDLHGPVMARYADDERRLVVWSDGRLAILDAATGGRRDVTAAAPIIDLHVIGITAYWVDRQHTMWQLDLVGTTPVAVAIPEKLRAIAPSPDGRWIALLGEDHLLLYDRTQPETPPWQVTQGTTRSLAWAPDGDYLVALVEQSLSGASVLGVMLAPEPRLVQRVMAPHVQHVAYADRLIYTAGTTGAAILSRETEGAPPLHQLTGTPVALAVSRGGTVVAAATAELLTMSPAGVHHMPLSGARIEDAIASPRSPYVIAAVEDRLLVWNLDDHEPRRIDDPSSNIPRFATADQVVISGNYDHQAHAIDLATGASHDLGAWQQLHDVVAVRGPRATAPTVASIDDAHHLHLAVPGRPTEDLPDEIDLAAFATPDQLVLATRDGELYLHDVEHDTRVPLVVPRAKLLGLAWGRGHHPWIAAAFADGTLWRKNLVTGVTATIARAPQLDPAHLIEPDGKLLVDADGSVMFLHDTGVHVWRADGSLARLARTPKPLDDLGEAGPAHVVAFAADHSVYTIERDATDERDATARIVEPFPGIDAPGAAMSPDTGFFVYGEQGAIRFADPLARQLWTLAAAGDDPFLDPQISPDGRRVLARTAKGVLVWSLDLPDGPDATARWLDAMTNAEGDTDPKAIRWH